MKLKTAFYMIIITAVLSGLWGMPAQAQQESLDSILAKITAKSFLIILTRPELNSTMNFYLLPYGGNIKGAKKLQQSGVDSFEIISSGWISKTAVLPYCDMICDFQVIYPDWLSKTAYQTKAILQPGNREITVYTRNYNRRWRVEDFDLQAKNSGKTSAVSTSTTNNNSSEAIQPVSVNGEGLLVFQVWSGSEIYIINADGTGLRWLTNGMDPQLSPDGTQVTFTRWQPRYELFTINVDGSGERAWTHGWRKMKSPTWSADGSRLIFSYQNGGRLDPLHKKVNLLKEAIQNDPVKIPSEAVGVDVKYGILQYTLPADAYWFLKEIDLASGQFNDLATERHSYGSSAHPLDANLVAYKGKNGIALNNRVTNTDVPISTDHRDHTPVISPDGSRVAVSYWQDGHWEIHTMLLDGTARRRLTTMSVTDLAAQSRLVQGEHMGITRIIPAENVWWNNAAPTWSPDGSQIAFLTDRSGKWEIWIMNADGTDQRPMFSNGALDKITINYAGVDERMLSWR